MFHAHMHLDTTHSPIEMDVAQRHGYHPTTQHISDNSTQRNSTNVIQRLHKPYIKRNSLSINSTKKDKTRYYKQWEMYMYLCMYV